MPESHCEMQSSMDASLFVALFAFPLYVFLLYGLARNLSVFLAVITERVLSTYKKVLQLGLSERLKIVLGLEINPGALGQPFFPIRVSGCKVFPFSVILISFYFM